MGFISEIIGIPLGWVMWLCYTLVRNYGVALIIFTLITKALMFPMSLKQQKSSVKMAMVKPITSHNKWVAMVVVNGVAKWQFVT